MHTLRPGQDGYAEEVAGFQTAVPSSPAVVVAAESAEDVVAAVRYAAAHGLPVAVQATGHGLTAGTDGLLISTRRMTGVEIDASARTARVEAGARWGAVIEAAGEHGLAPLSGSSPDVGVVGYTLAGGFGLMARRYGRAADHVRALDVVTADGELRRVEPGSDLFWALRGGRDSFGVVTAVEFDLFPVSHLYGGGLYFAPEDVPAALRAWRTWSAAAPDALTTSLAMVEYPDLPVLPAPLRGKHIAQIRVAYLGEDGDELVAPLRAAAPVLMDTLKVMPFTESGSIAAEPRQPHGYHGTNATVSQLNDAMLDAVVEHAGPGAATPPVLIIDRLGGALARPAAVTGVGWDSSAEFVVRALSLVGDGGVAAVRTAHAKLFDTLAPWTTGRLLPFVYGEHAAIEGVHPAADLRRLGELKRRYDVRSTFRALGPEAKAR
ncbi:FAD-binding oxidoreductase [Amycolatopsis sp. SID8362]|uniref:FAD-binding oxidoreductase n=1 Tax=Amycolatopsis sp. SID8362 TaxID=2690346 RepID=UPI001369DACD|nr:FAD-binding oxidoreductase [Amycolatopsis sp. SID8362]NBH06363.1 FAD-binding protein [Amycolatopsis sp. SID8362]NED43061.1 FAD-binding oxidoreductase [Amycolatopsis sp. SID8362]